MQLPVWLISSSSKLNTNAVPGVIHRDDNSVTIIKRVSTNSTKSSFATSVAIRTTDAMTMTAVAQAAIAAATATISADRIHAQTVDGINFALPNGVDI